MSGKKEGDQPFALVQSRKREIDWLYLTPLFLMGLPLIRIALKHNPVLRDRVFYSCVGLGLIHGTWLIARSQPDEEAEEFHTPTNAVARRTAKEVR